MAELVLQLDQVARHGQLLAAVVDHADVEIAVFRQPEGLPGGHVDLLEQAHIAGAFGDGLGKLRLNGGVLVGIIGQKAGDKVGHGHADAADLFGQGFD